MVIVRNSVHQIKAEIPLHNPSETAELPSNEIQKAGLAERCKHFLEVLSEGCRSSCETSIREDHVLISQSGLPDK